MKNKLEWIRSDQKLPKPDVLVWVAVRNKNMEDGIWLHDTCWHTGECWAERPNTWEDIVYWAYPVNPE
ncbi:MAG: hypothetical protein M0P12_03230 [Paludibacteraceae bacterium]|nr:hypothetical protein [Paludibacteraceae bacterium]